MVLAAATAAGAAWLALRDAGPRSSDAKMEVAAALRGVKLRGRGWELVADSAEVGRDQDRVTLWGVRRASLSRSGKRLLSVTSQRLDLNRRTGDMHFSGDVRLAAAGGLVVKTESVGWQAERQLVAGRSPATVSLGEAAMKVSAFSYSAREKRLECTRGVRLATADSYVTGERMVVLLEPRQVHLAGNIRARMAVDEAEQFMSSGPGGAVRRLLSFPRL